LHYDLPISSLAFLTNLPSVPLVTNMMWNFPHFIIQGIFHINLLGKRQCLVCLLNIIIYEKYGIHQDLDEVYNNFRHYCEWVMNAWSKLDDLPNLSYLHSRGHASTLRKTNKTNKLGMCASNLSYQSFFLAIWCWFAPKNLGLQWPVENKQ